MLHWHCRPCLTVSMRSLQGQWKELADATSAGAAAVSPGAQRDCGADVPPVTAAAYHATALSRLQQWPLVAEQLRGLNIDRSGLPLIVKSVAERELCSTPANCLEARHCHRLTCPCSLSPR